MFDQIIYLPKFGDDKMSNTERNAIAGIIKAGEELSIPTCAWNVYLHRIPKKILFVSLGGDGTMLTAMREATLNATSTVVGVNMGKLGFLTSTDKFRLSEMYASSEDIFYTLIMDLFHGGNNWQLTQRMVIGADMHTGHDNIVTAVAVNEFLVTTPTRRNPLQYDIRINGQSIAEHQGDGVIISTASGSTAYSLSAGGAIMTPSSTAIQIVPLAAHTLSAKPIVVGGEDNISIRANLNQRAGKVSVFNDGCETGVFDKKSGDNFQLDITERKMVNVWYPIDWNFFDVLTEKMGW